MGLLSLSLKGLFTIDSRALLESEKITALVIAVCDAINRHASRMPRHSPVNTDVCGGH